MSIIPNSEARSFYGLLLTARVPFAFIYHCGERQPSVASTCLSVAEQSFSASSLSSRDRTRINPSSRCAPRLIEIGQINRLRTGCSDLWGARHYTYLFIRRASVHNSLYRKVECSPPPLHIPIYFSLYIYTSPSCVRYFLLLVAGYEKPPTNSRRFRVIRNNNIFVIHGYNVKNVPCERNARCGSWAKRSPPSCQLRRLRRELGDFDELSHLSSVEERILQNRQSRWESPFRRLNSIRGENGLWHRAKTDLYLATADLVSCELNR